MLSLPEEQQSDDLATVGITNLLLQAASPAVKERADSVTNSSVASFYPIMNNGPQSLNLTRFGRAQSPATLMELLLTHLSKSSTETKDIVYALVGLSTSVDTFGLLDYTASEGATFIQAAKHIVETAVQLDIICVRQNDDNKYDLPS